MTAVVHGVYDCLGVVCCCTPIFDRFVERRDGRTASDWFAVPALGDDPGALPAPLRGVFWLDGNHDPSLLSFTTARWDPRARQVHFPIYAVDAWASTSRLSHSTCLRSGYVATFDADTARGRIRTTSEYSCVRVFCCCVCCQDRLAEYTVEKTDDPDVWTRESWLCRPCCGDKLFAAYRFTRVLDGDGRPTRHYDAMAATADVKTLYTRTPCPLYCGADRSHHAMTRGGADGRVGVAPTSEAIAR